MSDESAVIEGSEVAVQEPVKEPVSPQAEETTPAPDQPTQETVDGEKPHPLSPEGDRFKQVWARGKAAEAKAAELEARLQQEREERIRYEERLKALEETKASKPEVTWEQYEAAIEAGQITRAQAMTAWTQQLEKRAEERVAKRIEAQLQATAKQSTVLTEINRYKQALPEVAVPGSEIRQKIEREFSYLVGLGYDPKSYATELAATRAALGDIETVERSAAARKTTTKEPFMETHSSTRKPEPPGKKAIEKLDTRQKEHYDKMIKAGRYSGWDEVEQELNYTPPSLRVRRG